jgi:hypothetical protein
MTIISNIYKNIIYLIFGEENLKKLNKIIKEREKDEIIYLNIGGEYFHFSKSIIQKEGDNLILDYDKNKSSLKDKKSNLFIDRNPVILNL